MAARLPCGMAAAAARRCAVAWGFGTEHHRIIYQFCKNNTGISAARREKAEFTTEAQRKRGQSPFQDANNTARHFDQREKSCPPQTDCRRGTRDFSAASRRRNDGVGVTWRASGGEANLVCGRSGFPPLIVRSRLRRHLERRGNGAKGWRRFCPVAATGES